jgi:outer membrane receptor protein involved in Fe transport
VLYRMKMLDEIDFDPATFTYANIGRSTHAGAELDGTMRIGPLASAGISYAWTRVAPESGDGYQLKNIPRHLLRPHMTLTLPHGVVIHTRYVRTAGAFADDANQVHLGDRSTIDMRIAKKFSKTTVKLDLMNLTGNAYEEAGYVLSDFRGASVPYFYPAPGFSARAGLELGF